MRTFRHIATLLAIAATTLPVSAQRVPASALERRVRIQTAEASIVTGQVVRVAADSVTLRSDKTREIVSLAQTDILYAEEWNGSTAGLGAQRGALIGAGLGIVTITFGLLADAKVEGESMGPSNVAIAAPAAVLLTLLGAGIGAMSSGDSWKQLAPVTVSSSARQGQAVSVGLRLRF